MLQKPEDQNGQDDKWDEPKKGKNVAFFGDGKKKGGRSRSRKDTGEYVSQSTIDSPPKPEKDDDEEEEEQVGMFNDVTMTDHFNAQNKQVDRMFTVELTLKLKAKGGKNVTVPILAENIRASIVEEALALAMKARRVKTVLKAVLDVPDVK